MLSSRLWVLLLSISALVSCGDEEFPHRCGARSEAEDRCLDDSVKVRAGRAAVDQDAGSVTASEPPPDASSPDAARADAGESDAKPDELEAGPRCTGPTRHFAPSCPGVAWQGSPEHFAVQIAPGCYRPCTTSRDAICGQGTRCGRAAFAATACNGGSCTQVCAETWLCLSLDRFPSDVGWEEDAGSDNDDGSDAGWRW